MTRDELAAVVGEVLDTPRTVPGRHDTIMRAADLYAAGQIALAVAVPAGPARGEPCTT